jgi:hypothetical protein
MSTVRRRFSVRRVLLAAAAGALGAALAFAAGSGGVGHSAAPATSHHIVADGGDLVISGDFVISGD